MEWRIELRDPVQGHGYLVAKCDKVARGECRWSISRQPAANGVWQWDGNVERPNINPSIWCHGAGCERHFTMVGGHPHGAT